MEREKLTVLLNEADIRRMAEIAYSKDINKRLRTTANILRAVFEFFIFAAFITCSVTVLKDPLIMTDAYTGAIVAGVAVLAVIVGLVIILAEINAGKKRKKRAEAYYQNELNRRKNGFLPRTYIFEKDGIHTCGRYSDFVVSYDELQECHEYSDGVFFKYESGQVLWLPARFFTKSLAEEACGAMKYVFMKNYFLHEKLSVPEIPETVTAEQLIMPQGEADYIIEYKADKFSIFQRALNAVLGKRTLLLIIIIIAFIYMASAAADIILSLISKAYMQFNANSIFEICCFGLMLSGMVILATSFITNFVLLPHRIYKANVKWLREGTRLELYENGFVEKIAAGRTFTPWDNIQTVLYSAGDLMIMDKTGRGIVIPESALKEKREEIENAIRKHLPHEHEHNHDHGEHCDCGHDHHHEHDENCSCGCEHEHSHNHDHGEGCGCEECEEK